MEDDPINSLSPVGMGRWDAFRSRWDERFDHGDVDHWSRLARSIERRFVPVQASKG